MSMVGARPLSPGRSETQSSGVRRHHALEALPVLCGGRVRPPSQDTGVLRRGRRCLRRPRDSHEVRTPDREVEGRRDDDRHTGTGSVGGETRTVLLGPQSPFLLRTFPTRDGVRRHISCGPGTTRSVFPGGVPRRTRGAPVSVTEPRLRTGVSPVRAYSTVLLSVLLTLRSGPTRSPVRGDPFAEDDVDRTRSYPRPWQTSDPRRTSS